MYSVYVYSRIILRWTWYFSSTFVSSYSLMLTFTFSNILTPISLAKSVFMYYPSKSHIFYWEIHWMLVLGNSYHGLEYLVYCFFSNGIISLRVDLLLDRVLSIITALCKCLQRWSPCCISCIYNHSKCNICRVVVSVLAVMKYEFHDLRHGGWCPSSKQCLLQSIHVIGLWNILIAIQLLTKIATPICMLLFVHPQVTALYIIFLSMVPASLALIVAYIRISSQEGKEYSEKNFG